MNVELGTFLNLFNTIDEGVGKENLLGRILEKSKIAQDEKGSRGYRLANGPAVFRAQRSMLVQDIEFDLEKLVAALSSSLLPLLRRWEAAHNNSTNSRTSQVTVFIDTISSRDANYSKDLLNADS